MKSICIRLRPVGDVNQEVIEFLRSELQKRFGKVQVLKPIELSRECYSQDREQYNSTCLLRKLEPFFVTLGVTEVDIYAGRMNFVFGEAELGGTRAMISIYRLRLNADIELIKQRSIKEAVHEIGHVLGLKHCSRRECVMSFSNSVFEVDMKSDEFCNRCYSRVRRFLIEE
jgi:archaemetzincin